MHPNRRFIRHYLEMVAAMMVGMVVLGVSADAVYDVSDRSPLLLVEMALTMTIPMVAWMRFRGHAWQRCHEMAASMLLPLFGTLALFGSGLVTSIDALLGLEHMVMFPSMLAVMLLRRDEYAGHRHHHGLAAA